MPFSLETKEQHYVREIMELLDGGESPSVAMTTLGKKYKIETAELYTIFNKMAGLTAMEYCACVRLSATENAKENAKHDTKVLDKQVA